MASQASCNYSSCAAPLISLRDVVKAYPSAAGPLLALKGISADVLPGEFVGIIGRSGAGKSTLVNMISAVDRLTSGEITVGGTAVHQLDEDQAALWRGRNLGIVYQSFQLLPMLSLLDNVMLPMDLCGRYRPRESRQRAMDILRQVGLEAHAGKPPTGISGGQQQRVAIGRALANDPPIIIADEPTGNLDSVTARGILDLFADLARRGRTIIMVTHDRGLAPYFTRVLHIADGELVGEAVAS